MSKKNSSNRSELIFITLSWDTTNVLLRHTFDWVAESKKYFTRVNVYATHVNQKILNNADPDISIYEFGGGNSLNRIKGICKILLLTFNLVRRKEKYVVLYHMNVLPVLIMGWALKIAKIPQGIWYSHNASGLKLSIAEKLVDYCFSTSSMTFPLKSKKVKAIGHGLDVSWMPDEIHARRKNVILAVGRISDVKRLEDIILATSRVSFNQPRIRLIGKVHQEQYFLNLLDLASKLGVELEYAGELDREALIIELTQAGMIYSGTRGSVDKAVLEGAINGCLVVSQNPTVISASGQEQVVYQKFGISMQKLSLQSQIEFFLKIQEEGDVRRSLSNLCMEKNSLQKMMGVMKTYLVGK